MDIPAILNSIRPNSRWTLNGDEYEGLTWLDDSPKPTKKTVADAWPQVQHAIKWNAVRIERDRRLAASDWTQVVDAPLTDEVMVAWAAYRQELRDIPQTFDDPDQVVWPTEP